jgi:acetyltransferase-like isoleucine patch superfamily enzyme
MLSCSNAHIKFGDSVSVGPNCKFITKNRIEIGSNVAIGQDVKVSGATHAFQDSGIPILEQERISRGVIIGDNVWIGIGATILDGVTVGDGAIVGAGTVVSRDVEAGSVVLGNPARVVQKRQKAAQN